MTSIPIRRLMKSPEARIGGLFKTAIDGRPWNWYYDF